MAKILIIDDSSFQRRMVRAILSRLGHEVVEANCGTTGLAALETESPDLLLVDLLMPGLTGYDVLERIQASQSTVPRIVLTADVQESAAERCRSLGASDVLHKPPKEARLKEAIDLALAAEEAPR